MHSTVSHLLQLWDHLGANSRISCSATLTLSAEGKQRHDNGPGSSGTEHLRQCGRDHASDSDARAADRAFAALHDPVAERLRHHQRHDRTLVMRRFSRREMLLGGASTLLMAQKPMASSGAFEPTTSVALTVIAQRGFQENGHFWCTEISQH
jgi:hypothetical protein